MYKNQKFLAFASPIYEMQNSCQIELPQIRLFCLNNLNNVRSLTYKLCTLSLASTTSVNLMPKRSPIITTSPLAILVPLTKISKGSPASLSNSTTEPSFILSNSLSFISAPPTSTVSLTSIFSKTLKFSKPVLSLFSTLSE